MSYQHKSYYGNICMDRMYCEECGTYCLIIDGIKQCCDEPVKVTKSKKIKIMSPPEKKRRCLSKKDRVAILEKQGNKCFYCGREFGSYYYRDGKKKVLKLHYDHIMPYVGTYNNNAKNIVAACHICNLIKSSHVFKTIEQAKDHINDRRLVKGIRYEDEPEVLEELYCEECGKLITKNKRFCSKECSNRNWINNHPRRPIKK